MRTLRVCLNDGDIPVVSAHYRRLGCINLLGCFAWDLPGAHSCPPVKILRECCPMRRIPMMMPAISGFTQHMVECVRIHLYILHTYV